MKLLGIDPGPNEWHYALVDTEKKKILQHGTITTAGTFPDHDEVCAEMIQCYGPDVSVGMSVFMTCLMIGRLQERLPGLRMLTRTQVKAYVTGRANTKGKDVRAGCIKFWGEVGTKNAPGPTYGITADRWAALGVATAWMLSSKESFVPSLEKKVKKSKKRKTTRII